MVVLITFGWSWKFSVREGEGQVYILGGLFYWQEERWTRRRPVTRPELGQWNRFREGVELEFKFRRFKLPKLVKIRYHKWAKWESDFLFRLWLIAQKVVPFTLRSVCVFNGNLMWLKLVIMLFVLTNHFEFHAFEIWALLQLAGENKTPGDIFVLVINTWKLWVFRY